MYLKYNYFVILKMSLLSTCNTCNQIDVFTISGGGGGGISTNCSCTQLVYQHIQKHCYILNFFKYADISNLWLAVYAKLCVLIILL